MTHVIDSDVDMRTLAKKRKGFSLVELIIVIGVLAILAVAAIMIIGNVRDNARTAANRSNAQSIIRAVNTHNSLSTTPHTLTGDSAAMSTALAALVLTEDEAGGTEMNLGISISADEYAEAWAWIDPIAGSDPPMYQLGDGP